MQAYFSSPDLAFCASDWESGLSSSLQFLCDACEPFVVSSLMQAYFSSPDLAFFASEWESGLSSAVQFLCAALQTLDVSRRSCKPILVRRSGVLCQGLGSGLSGSLQLFVCCLQG